MVRELSVGLMVMQQFNISLSVNPHPHPPRGGNSSSEERPRNNPERSQNEPTSNYKRPTEQVALAITRLASVREVTCSQLCSTGGLPQLPLSLQFCTPAKYLEKSEDCVLSHLCHFFSHQAFTTRRCTVCDTDSVLKWNI